jgi:hypothetical protein
MASLPTDANASVTLVAFEIRETVLPLVPSPTGYSHGVCGGLAIRRSGPRWDTTTGRYAERPPSSDAVSNWMRSWPTASSHAVDANRKLVVPAAAFAYASRAFANGITSSVVGRDRSVGGFTGQRRRDRRG